MTRFPGVTRRPDSTVWGFVLRAPQDLLHRFKGKPWAVRCSLATSDLRQANDKARALHAEWADRFAAMRREDNPQRVTLTPALVATITAEVRRWVLQADDNMRDFPEGPRTLLAREERQRMLAVIAKAEASPLAALWPLEPAPGALAGLTIAGSANAPATIHPPHDPLGGIPEDERGALSRFNAQADERAAKDMGGRNLRAALPLAEAVTKSMGKQGDWLTPEGREGLLKVLEAYRQAVADVVRRDAGEVIETPTQAKPQAGPHGGPGSTQATKQGHTTKDAFEAWENDEPGRKRKTVDAYRTEARKLAGLLDGRPLETMNREDGRRFIGTLLKEADGRGPKGRNTAVKILSRWKTFLSKAVDLEWIDKSPLAGMTIDRVPTDRDEWSPDELVKLFDDPLFKSYSIPSASMAGRDAAYWLPLLGLFTGARISELAQLGINDVQRTEAAGWVLSIHEEEEGQSVKNMGAVRQVPIHPELIRLGLIDYWQAVKDLGASRLWPAVVFTDLNGAGGKVSQWFSKFKTGKGFGRDRVFHSFRHTLQTRLLALGVPESHADTLAGRAGKSVSRRSYTHLKPADVRPSLERLQFPGLVLPRVFKVPAWKPDSTD